MYGHNNNNNNNNDDDDKDNNDEKINTTKFLYAFTQKVLNSDGSIRWVGITDQNGIIINERDRKGLKPFLTIEENHEFAINTINRHKTRLKFEPKMGKIFYYLNYIRLKTHSYLELITLSIIRYH